MELLHAPLDLASVDVAGSVIPFSNSVKILYVTLYPHLTFNKHVDRIRTSAHYHIRSLRHIRSSVTHEMVRTIGGALVGLRDTVGTIVYSVKINKLADCCRPTLVIRYENIILR